MQKPKISQTQSKMADQAVINETIMKAVAEVTRFMTQTMAETQNQRSENQPGLS